MFSIRLHRCPYWNSEVTVRLMLAHKRLAYAVSPRLPYGRLCKLALGCTTADEPMLDVDGERVHGARCIARVLDELSARSPLFPRDPACRRAVEDAERWGEGFARSALRLSYHAARRERELRRAVMTAPSCRRSRDAAWQTAASRLATLAAAAHGASEAVARESVALLPERLARVDALIDAGVLNGDELNAADFQIAPAVAGLLCSDDLWLYATERPAAALAARVLALDPRCAVLPVGAPAAVA